MPAASFAFDSEQNHENTLLSSVASRELHSHRDRFELGQKISVSFSTTEAELDAIPNAAFLLLADRQSQSGVVYNSGSLHAVNEQSHLNLSLLKAF